MDIEPVDSARRHEVTQALQCRPHQGRPTIAVIQKLHRLGQRAPVGRDTLAQRCELAGNGLGRGLAFGRDAGVNRGLDRLHAESLLLTGCCGMNWPACGVGSVWEGVVRCLLGTTQSYACTTQAGLLWPGSNTIRTSRIWRGV